MTKRYAWRLGAPLLTLALSGSALAAQQPGTVELNGFGSIAFFDEQSTLTDHPQAGLGAGVGLFVLPNLALEASAAFTPTDLAVNEADVTWVPLRARVAYHFPATEDVYPIIGIGYTRHEFSDAIEASDDAVTGLLGIKAYLSERLAVRMDAQYDFAWAPFNESNSIGEHETWSFAAGLSYDLGPGRSRDSDGDGVRDRRDACPATPMGVSVNERGCRIDSDGDGVFNEDDRCANTPAGVAVDGSGCRVDSDGDGVFDEDDRCASTPAGATVDASGCRVDSDGDGVFDDDDRCSNTPAGASVDSRGCRVDSDGDGVYDENDRCPDTASGTEVDSRGCPVLFEEESTSLVLEGVTFETSSAQLTGAAQVILDRVAESLRGNTDVRVQVVGHTDNTGSRDFNLRLSRERAESVVAYLVAQGVDAGQLEARGAGPDEPVATNDTEDGRQQNRRVELVRIGG